jgi:hypothetical protein
MSILGAAKNLPVRRLGADGKTKKPLRATKSQGFDIGVFGMNRGMPGLPKDLGLGRLILRPVGIFFRLGHALVQSAQSFFLMLIFTFQLFLALREAVVRSSQCFPLRRHAFRLSYLNGAPLKLITRIARLEAESKTLPVFHPLPAAFL